MAASGPTYSLCDIYIGEYTHLISCKGRIFFEVLGPLDDAPDDASTSSSSALAAG
jgi:hypothetical protein